MYHFDTSNQRKPQGYATYNPNCRALLDLAWVRDDSPDHNGHVYWYI